MQTAKFTLTLHPFHSVPLRGVTPAELVVLRELHFKESQGTPIGPDLQLEPGEAVTVEQEGRAGEPEYFNQQSGKVVPAKPEVPPVTHKRTDQEEIARLKRKYVAPIPHIKGSKPAFAQTFGESAMVALPQTFDEVLERLGLPGILPDNAETIDTTSVDGLVKLSRFELVQRAVDLKLRVKSTDQKNEIAAAILDAEAKRSSQKDRVSKSDFLEDYQTADRKTLLSLKAELESDDQGRPKVANALAAVNELLNLTH